MFDDNTSERQLEAKLDELADMVTRADVRLDTLRMAFNQTLEDAQDSLCEAWKIARNLRNVLKTVNEAQQQQKEKQP